MKHSPNLVPTAIVDKNGKATTVHKRASNTTSTLRGPLPAAASSNKSRTLDELADETISLLDDVYPPDIMNGDRYRVERINDRLRTLFDLKHMADINSIVKMYVDGDGPKDPDFSTMIWFLDNYFESKTVALISAHREYLSQHDGNLNDFIALAGKLPEIAGSKVDNHGRMPTIEAHIAAQHHFEEHLNSPKIIPYNDYIHNKSYVQAVEKHWDKLDALLDYIDERKLMHPKWGLKDFDDRIFEESLERGPVGKGWL